jgi:hypothetical protein
VSPAEGAPAPARRSFLRRYGIALAAAGVALAFALWIFLGPYLTVRKLLNGVRERDAAKVSECLDYPALRESMKSELGKTVSESIGADNPLAGIASGLTLTFGDALVDRFLTPEGLAMLMAGQKPTLASRFSNAPEAALLVGATYGYESFDEFVVKVPSPGGAFRFVLTRSGLSWKLTRIELPI